MNAKTRDQGYPQLRAMWRMAEALIAAIADTAPRMIGAGCQTIIVKQTCGVAPRCCANPR
jgi:hypothetical protein